MIICKYLERLGRGVSEDTIPSIAWKDSEKTLEKDFSQDKGKFVHMFN
jgi:hypothetical protein